MRYGVQPGNAQSGCCKSIDSSQSSSANITCAKRARGSWRSFQKLGGKKSSFLFIPVSGLSLPYPTRRENKRRTTRIFPIYTSLYAYVLRLYVYIYVCTYEKIYTAVCIHIYYCLVSVYSMDSERWKENPPKVVRILKYPTNRSRRFYADWRAFRRITKAATRSKKTTF